LIVLDASALASWILPGEEGPDLLELARLHSEFQAPVLLWTELRNILVMNESCGRLTPGLSEDGLSMAERLGIDFDTQPASGTVLRLAREHGLTVYDVLYIEPAIRKGAVLATLDRAMAKAARAEGVTVI
jgi:predicted nucleic acid-binding protein